MSTQEETDPPIPPSKTIIKSLLKIPAIYNFMLLCLPGTVLLVFRVHQGKVLIIVYVVVAIVLLCVDLVQKSWKRVGISIGLLIIPGVLVLVFLKLKTSGVFLNLKTSGAILISISTGSIAVVLLLWRLLRRNKGVVVAEVEGTDQTQVDEESGYSLQDVADLPRRFSHQDLVSATDNFSQRLGGGGFGSVFLGSLSNGTQVAVKRLDQLGQGEREFLAEVKTIGSVHHVNLVRLAGFCAENSLRLLVYDYMSNGSLDRWIFNESRRTRVLKWDIRKGILVSIARGLAYLHEDCKMKIAHLDVKPQNILLDDTLNAKLSDFGLARMIDRNQSLAMTQMRGTRGYMAPEWLTGKITEKADVYSFGVVILETICGRRNFDTTQHDEDDIFLLLLTRKKAEEDKLVDIVDKCNKDMQQHVQEAVNTIRAAIWCLHQDPNRRPSMATVVKVLEGVITPEPIADHRFLTLDTEETALIIHSLSSNLQTASSLSGPR